MVTAVILAGGLGTRLALTVPHLPKALAPIQGIPFLHLLFHQLEVSGIVSKLVLALGHKAADIQSFLNRESLSFPIELSVESSPLGTGGALLHALPKVEGDTFLALNGDSYFDLSLSNFLNFHLSRQADISIACQKMEDVSRYGSIEIDSTARIISWAEKSPFKQPGWINGGLYFIQKSLLNSFAPGPYSLEKDFFPLFLRRQMFAYRHEGTFIDIGTPGSYNEAQQILKPWITQ